MTSLSPEDVRALEQTRQRLAQLTESLNSLNRDVHTTHPLPSWTSLTSRFSILAQNLSSLTTHLSSASSNRLNNMAVFPLPTKNFPAATAEQEGVLLQLLRKKMEPGVEGWVEEGGRWAVGLGEGGGGEMWRELWEWCPVKANEEARGYEWFVGEWTRGEREAGMDEEEEDEEEDGEGNEGEGEGGEDVGGEKVVLGKAVKMEDALRFMSTGVEPR
ncbi:MAG: hypothetical protein Q9182_001176 [Xanthomendoza sp. 2 TL-2023]